MKIRTGFVSNSSSSSFVIVGIHLEDMRGPELIEKILKSYELEEVAIENLKDEDWCGFFESLGLDVENDDNIFIVGKFLFSDFEDDISNFDIKEIETTINEAKTKLKEFMEKTGINESIKITAGVSYN